MVVEVFMVYRVNGEVDEMVIDEGMGEEEVGRLLGSQQWVAMLNTKNVKAMVYAEVATERFLIYSFTRYTFAVINCGSQVNEIVAVRLAGLTQHSVRALLFPPLSSPHRKHFFHMPYTPNSPDWSKDEPVLSLALKLYLD